MTSLSGVGFTGRFTGRFSIETGQPFERVDVRLEPNGIEISGRSGEQPLLWPYGALATREPLSDKAIEAVVTYRFQPGARLFVSDRIFARELSQRAPQVSKRAHRWRQVRPWLWAAAGVLALLAVIQLANLSPAQSIAGLMPQTVRAKIGEQVVGQMVQGRKVCEANAGRAALDGLVQRLVPTRDRERFKVTAVDWELVNAFAAPGDHIVITRGLIEKAGGPDELAGVVAHEIGHAIALHPEAAIVRTVGMAAAVEMVLGGGGLLTGLGISLTQLAYSREAEREADEAAIVMLRNAGISADGLAAFFRRVAALEEGKDAKSGLGDLNMLRTHPQTKERLARVRQVETYPASPALSPSEWAALKSICTVSGSRKN